MRLSIRWRLTLWNILALAVVLAGSAALVYGMLARALYQRLDQSLRTEFLELSSDPLLAGAPKERLRYWVTELHDTEGMLCVVYDSRGKVVQRPKGLSARRVPPAPVVALGETRLEDAMVAGVGQQRVLCSRIRVGDAELTIRLMAPVGEVEGLLHQLVVVFCIAGPVALVFAGAVSYWLARKALTPMEELHTLTEQITAEHLDRRLPVANAHDELGRLARTINAMIGRLERSFLEIRRFTADASHELRTPLTAIRTEAEVALARPLTVEGHQHLLGSILEECERLTRLADQLLTLSREDAGAAAPAFEPVDLAALLDHVVETMRPLAEARRLRLGYEGNGTLPVLGDHARLRQVFYNLLDNAIKFTPEGGAVDVQVRRQEGNAAVTVRDTGIGIPAENLPHVFERFYRVDKARSRFAGGTGLGLSIARSIVAAHGGSVEVASLPGQGATFTVSLPSQLPDG